MSASSSNPNPNPNPNPNSSSFFANLFKKNPNTPAPPPPPHATPHAPQPNQRQQHGSSNVIPKLLTGINIFVVIIAIIFIILTFIALFNPSLFTSYNGMTLTDEKIAANVSVIVFFVLIICGLLVYYLPQLSDVKKFLVQFKSVVVVILYTIFLILLYSLTPEDFMNQYTYIITPITIALAIFVFYKGVKQNYLKDFNINYERIKTMILFLCFITTMFVYYSCNTGGFIQYYFGPTLIITILLAFFALLYVIIVLALPEKQSGTTNPLSKSNFFSNFSKFSVYGSIGFVIYLIISIVGVMYITGYLNQPPTDPTAVPSSIYGTTANVQQNTSDSSAYSSTSTSQTDSSIFGSNTNTSSSPYQSYLDFSFLKVGGNEYNFEIPLLSSYINTEGFTTTSNSSVENGSLTLAVVFVLITTVMFGAALLMNIYPESLEYFTTNRVSNINEFSLFKRSLLILFALVISGLFITWLVYYIQSFSNSTGIVSFILNLLLILAILTLLYKIFYVKLPSNEVNRRKNSFFDLIISIILYIPCIFSTLFDSLVTIATGKEYSTTTTSILLIIIAIILFIIYIKLPSLEEKITLQGGDLIVNRPIRTTTLTSLATYAELNGNDNPNYEYGISFWFYIDAMPPSSGTSYNEYASILNYGNKPNISYNVSENTLRFTMEQVKKIAFDSGLPGTKKEYIDLNTQQVVYDRKDILLQKWNNLIINYTGGTLDIFLNNELIKSAIGIVPYMTNDSLTIGEKNGIMGGVCSVVYFKKPIRSSQMFYLYNMVKDKTPPIVDNSSKTIIVNN